MKDTEKQRKYLVAVLMQQGVTDKNVLDAIGKVERESFVSSDMLEHAYENIPLPIGHGQTISQPYTVAFMLQELDLKPGQNVLEIGTGSGYNAAVISRIIGDTGSLFTIEYVKELADNAKKILKDYKNVEVINADGSLGYEKKAPYDRIISTAGSPKISENWQEQLKEGGIIIAPVGKTIQNMIKAVKTDGKLKQQELGVFAFVPLKGEKGY